MVDVRSCRITVGQVAAVIHTSQLFGILSDENENIFDKNPPLPLHTP